MNSIETLQNSLLDCLPDVELQLDPSVSPDGSWWLDVKNQEHSLVVEWKPSKGFGVSSDDISYGEGPDEVYPDEKATLARVLPILQGGLETKPPAKVLLRRLRELCGLTQEQLAAKLGVKQSTVSRFEGGADMHLSTLKRLINSMGGELQIRAVFNDETVVLEEQLT